MLTTLTKIFLQKKLILIFILTILFCWIVIGMYQHGPTFMALWGVLPLLKWLLFVISFSDLVISNITTAGLVILILNIVGIALYITMKVFAYQLQARTKSVTGVMGAILVFFGIGCASCGSLALISIVSLLGFGGALALLPFDGHEIPYFALVLLIISNYILLRQLAKKVCPI